MNKLRVRRYNIDPENWVSEQRLEYVTRDILGREVVTVVDSEIIPKDVMITLGCCGDTGGWKSKFANWIGKE